MSPEERKRLPLNALMLKAMHDRERLVAAAETNGGSRADLAPADREIVRKASRFARFAAASYGVLGNLGHMTAIVAKEPGMPPPDLTMNRCKDWAPR